MHLNTGGFGFGESDTVLGAAFASRRCTCTRHLSNQGTLFNDGSRLPPGHWEASATFRTCSAYGKTRADVSSQFTQFFEQSDTHRGSTRQTSDETHKTPYENAFNALRTDLCAFSMEFSDSGPTRTTNSHSFQSFIDSGTVKNMKNLRPSRECVHVNRGRDITIWRI